MVEFTLAVSTIFITPILNRLLSLIIIMIINILITNSNNKVFKSKKSLGAAASVKQMCLDS